MPDPTSVVPFAVPRRMPNPLPDDIPAPQPGPTAEIVRQRIQQAIAEGLSASEALARIAQEFFGGDTGVANSWVTSNMTPRAPAQTSTALPQVSSTVLPEVPLTPPQLPIATPMQQANSSRDRSTDTTTGQLRSWDGRAGT